MNNKPLLAAYGVTFAYHNDLVLDGLSLELKKGQLGSVLGPNGSGKSTFLKIISGMYSLKGGHNSGYIYYRGHDFHKYSTSERAKKVVYVPPDVRVEFPLSAYEMVLLGRLCQGGGFFKRTTQHDRDLAHWAMEQCCCWGLRERNWSSLSGGQKQLVVLARALTQESKLILLDEALSKMDLHHQEKIGLLLRKLTKEDYSFLLVSHDINLSSEWSDFTLILKEGKKVACGKTSDVLNIETIQKTYPGSSLTVGKNPVSGMPKVFFGVKH